MRVYRVEHSVDKNGEFHRGPYRDCWDAPYNDVSGRMDEAHAEDYAHPPPWREDISIWKDELCGFETVQDLKRWFSGWLAELNQHGFVMAEYEVQPNRIKFGSKQIVFAAEDAQRVSAVPLSSIIL